MLPTASGYDDWLHIPIICKRTPVPVFLSLQCKSFLLQNMRSKEERFVAQWRSD
ncbi:hypothetical protein AVEN_107626-1, partial [Araneus ventricosus]